MGRSPVANSRHQGQASRQEVASACRRAARSRHASRLDVASAWRQSPAYRCADGTCSESARFPRADTGQYVAGLSNNGKTAIARRFLTRQVLPEDPQAEVSRIPVALIQAPNGPRIPQLLAAILAALGREVGARRTTAQLRTETYKAMQDVGLRLLLIDDLHNMKGSNAAAMLVELREIGSVTGVSLGCFATKEIAYVMRQDEQLANRLELFVLPRWHRDDPDYLRLLATFERALPLRQRSILTAPETAARILAMGEGLIGGIARVLRRAAAEAVRCGHERIDAAMLDRVRPGLPAALEDLAQAADL
ncbi:MAG TPA: TniB family NTP-binding protein [Acetobacteraceae bacterium]|nr:TniB family NTP-binding protein [Acetobacteraceae bacterium]